MAIECVNENEFYQMVAKMTNIFKHEIQRTFAYLGEKCVRRVRDRGAEESWIDHTGNLRSSIGYAIYDYGKKTIQSSFRQVFDGAEGTKKGREVVDELAKEYANTYALVVLAGMEYAEYVEAMESKDVLASTELWAKGEINGYLDKTMQRILKRIRNEFQ